MPSQTTRAAYSSEYTSFVSGSRPTAPIKTAIIRPTNFYEGLRHTGSATSSDGRVSDLVLDIESRGNGRSLEPDV